MFKSETGTGRKKEKLSGFLLELAQRKQQQQYTMEHFYAVKQIEGPCLKLIQRIRKKRGLSSLPPFHSCPALPSISLALPSSCSLLTASLPLTVSLQLLPLS
jgi:hypothetical protein